MDSYRLDGHKLYWHLDRVLAWQRGELVPPIYVEISPVAYCNHDCIFCGKEPAKRNNIRLNPEVMRERIKEMGRWGVRSVMFAGEGEPLLHPDLPSLVRETKEAGIDVALTTNGSLHNSSLWKEILPRLSWVKFSIDAGTAPVYSRVHRVPETQFDRTLANVEEAVKLKAQEGLEVAVGAQFLVVRENLDDLENAVGLLSQLGLDYLVFKPYSLHPHMAQERDVLYTREIVDRIQSLVDLHRDRSPTELIFRRDSMDRYREREKRYSHCYSLPFWGYLSSTGDFYTCGIFLGNERFKAGNIYRQAVPDILFGESRRRSIEFAARDLPVARECNLNCRMARVNEFLQHLRDKPGHINFI